MQFGPIGATVARQIPVLKVTCSNHVSVTQKSRAPPHGVSRNSRVPRTQAAARPCPRSPSRRRRSAPTRSQKKRRPLRYRGRVLKSREGGVAQWQSVRFACGKPRVQTPAPPHTHNSVAQWIAYQTSNLGVAGSSPVGVVLYSPECD